MHTCKVGNGDRKGSNVGSVAGSVESKEYNNNLPTGRGAVRYNREVTVGVRPDAKGGSTSGAEDSNDGGNKKPIGRGVVRY
jgi:hypothetical protein